MPHEEFTACIPELWGAGVLEAKTTFLREGRRRAAFGGAHLPEGCTPTEETAGNVTVLDGDRRFHLDAGHEPRQLAVVCDRSDSMLGISCDGAALRSAFDGWLAESGAAAGSVFGVYGVGRSRDGVQRLIHVSVPGRPAAERAALVLATREQLDASLRGAPRGSAIAEAVSVAATDLRRGVGIRSLLVLSDLRQVTPRTWNFETAAPAPAIFIEWLRANELAEDLGGISVRACGIHHRRAPGARRYNAVLARSVGTVWTAAFESMRADLVELRGDCEPDTLVNGRHK